MSVDTVSSPLRTDEGRSPTLPLLLGWFAVHVVVWIGLVRLVPGGDLVEFSELGALGTPWVRQFVVPLLVVASLQVVVLRWTGWTSSVLSDSSRSTTRWLWILPAYVVLIGVVSLARTGFGADAGGAYLVGVAVTVALVGFCEEVTFRGILVVGARRVLASERQVVVFTSVLFGLFHLPNILLGAEVGSTVGQVVMTSLMGACFYALRRLTGSLVPCIVLHAVYDFVLVQGNWDVLLP